MESAAKPSMKQAERVVQPKTKDICNLTFVCECSSRSNAHQARTSSRPVRAAGSQNREHGRSRAANASAYADAAATRGQAAGWRELLAASIAPCVSRSPASSSVCRH